MNGAVGTGGARSMRLLRKYIAPCATAMECCRGSSEGAACQANLDSRAAAGLALPSTSCHIPQLPASASPAANQYINPSRRKITSAPAAGQSQPGSLRDTRGWSRAWNTSLHTSALAFLYMKGPKGPGDWQLGSRAGSPLACLWMMFLACRYCRAAKKGGRMSRATCRSLYRPPARFRSSYRSPPGGKQISVA